MLQATIAAALTFLAGAASLTAVLAAYAPTA